jgi:hypothetical protein
MSIYTAVICSLIALNSCLLWGRMSTKTPSPVNYETVHPIDLAFWIAREYGPIALPPKLTRKQMSAVALDQLFAIERVDP